MNDWKASRIPVSALLPRISTRACYPAVSHFPTNMPLPAERFSFHPRTFHSPYSLLILIASRDELYFWCLPHGTINAESSECVSDDFGSRHQMLTNDGRVAAGFTLRWDDGDSRRAEASAGKLLSLQNFIIGLWLQSLTACCFKEIPGLQGKHNISTRFLNSFWTSIRL